MLGLVRPVSVGICGDAKPAAAALAAKLAARELACSATLSARADRIISEKSAWEKELDGWSHERDDWSLDIISRGGGRMHPRRILRELELAMPKHVMVSTDIGNICSVSNNYLRFDEPNSMLAAMSFGNCGYALPALIGAKLGRPDRPAVAYVGDGAWCMSFQELLTCVRERIPVTAVVFHNGQWGAERRTRWTSTVAVSSAAICRTRTSPSWRALWGRRACGSSTPTRWATLRAACKAQSEARPRCWR